MQNEIQELLNTAMDRELVSQAVYQAGQKKTEDRGAVSLMKELAEQEQRHFQWLKEFSQTGLQKTTAQPNKIADLKMSDYLLDTPISEGAGLQDVLTTAMKRERASIDFYTSMREALRGPAIRALCERLLEQERKHKLKVETLYDNMFNSEN